MSNRERLTWYLGLIKVDLIWLSMFYDGRFNTEEKWRNEMDRRLRNE